MFVTDAKWLQKGGHRKILAEALRKPMTGSELLHAMRKDCPRVQLRDIWRLLQQFQERGLACCLNPEETTGRLFFFTDKGRRIARQTLMISVTPLPALVNWKKYSHIVRGHTRKSVLLTMEMHWHGKIEKTIASVRRLLLQHNQSIGLGATIRAMRELERLKLVRRVGVTHKRNRPLYVLSISGKRIVKQLKA